MTFFNVRRSADLEGDIPLEEGEGPLPSFLFDLFRVVLPSARVLCSFS